MDLPFFTEFVREVEMLLQNPQVQKMRLYIQHGDTDCLLHCLCVSYLCYRICRFLHLHAGEMARAALLHDLFLYDWHAPATPGGTDSGIRGARSMKPGKLCP